MKEIPTPDQNTLKTRRILITRPQSQARELAKLLAAYGAKTVIHPAIEILAPSDWSEVDQVLGRLNQFGWIVFVSVNGVRHFFQRLEKLGIQQTQLANLQIGAIGEATAMELENRNLAVDLVPHRSDSGGVVKVLLQRLTSTNNRVLLIRANRGSEEIPNQLAQQNIPFTQIAVYRNADVQQVDPEVLAQMQNGQFDWVTVTSSAIARSLVNLFGDALQKTQLVSISPSTSQALQSLGYSPAAEASQFNMSGVVQAILDFELKGVGGG